jgi:hypothetical protein
MQLITQTQSMKIPSYVSLLSIPLILIILALPSVEMLLPDFERGYCMTTQFWTILAVLSLILGVWLTNRSKTPMATEMNAWDQLMQLQNYEDDHSSLR